MGDFLEKAYMQQALICTPQTHERAQIIRPWFFAPGSHDCLVIVPYQPLAMRMQISCSLK